MAKVICAWCDPDQANQPDVTSTVCARHHRLLTRQAEWAQAPRAFVKAFVPRDPWGVAKEGTTDAKSS